MRARGVQDYLHALVGYASAFVLGTLTGLDLLGFPRGTTLRLGAAAVVEVTGLAQPLQAA